MNEVTTRMSYPERKVAEYLKQKRIDWTYEQPVFIWDDEGRPRVWAPDFYLHQFGIYVKVCGSKDFDYEYRKRIFTNNGHLVIFIHIYKGTDKWEQHFRKYLRQFLVRRIRALSGIPI
jgi:hypothetical protein